MKKILIILVLLFSVFSFVQTSFADGILTSSSTDKLKSNTLTVKESAGLGTVTIGSIAAALIKAALGLLAVIFLILLIIAGFQWMTAAGNEQKTEKALSMIKTAVIGLIIVLAAYSITFFVFTYLPFSSSGAATSVQ